MEVNARNVLKKNKINFKNIGFLPGETNIFYEFKFLINFILELKKYNPHILHGISLKGVLYSCIYSRIFKVKKLICFITGLGYFFTGRLKIYELFLKHLILSIIKFSLKSKNSLLIIENNEDKKFFIKKVKIEKSKIMLFNGAGVNLKKFNSNKKKKILFYFQQEF